MKSLSEKNKGILSLVLLAFVFSSMGVFARYLQFDFSLFQQLYLRILGAFLLGLIIFFKDIDFSKLRQAPRRDWLLIVFRAVTLYGGILLISKAFFLSKYSNVAFAASLPLLPLFGYFLFKEKFTKAKAFYTLLAVVGLLLIAVKDFGHIFSWGQGETLAVLAVILFDFSYVARRWQTNLLSNKEITVSTFFVGGVLLFFVSFFVLHEPLPHLAAFSPFILLILLAAIVFNVANLFLTNYGFEKVEIITAGNILTLESVFSLLLSIFLYAEIPTLREFIGGALIVISVYRMNRLG